MGHDGRRVVPALVIALTLGIGILIGTLASHGVRANRGGFFAADAKPLPMPSPVELSNSFSQIADKVEEAVVNINTETTVRVTSHRQFHAPDDSTFNDFFDHFFQGGPGSPHGEGGDFRQQSLGSGVVLDKNGYILTNYHVITQNSEDKPVDRINVQLHGDDVTKYKAKIVGSDKWTDLAVIKIDAGKPLHAADLGNSDSMRVGDWVLAIGSPFGLDSTVTAGIVSAKGRDIEGGTQGQFKRFIQTDAAINPGNSGGPLVNLSGQVIGINTAIATRRGSYDGVGFAIPSNTVRKVYNSVITTGSVKRGAIGVQFNATTNPTLLHSFGTDHGIVIDSVQPDSPADRSGLKRGDVILNINGQSVHNGDELVSIVSDTEVGKKLHLEYLREGKHGTCDVEVADRNRIIGENRGPGEPPAGAESTPVTGGILGLAVQALSSEQSKELTGQLHLESKQGVLVVDVQASGFASDLGVDRGDVIISINHHVITSVDDYNKVQAQLKSGADVVLLVARRSGPRSFTTLFLADRLP